MITLSSGCAIGGCDGGLHPGIIFLIVLGVISFFAIIVMVAKKKKK